VCVGEGRGGGRGREQEGGGGGDVTFWYPSMTKAVLIKLRRKTYMWVIMDCLPNMYKFDGG
jgi:hypothetical protein